MGDSSIYRQSYFIAGDGYRCAYRHYPGRPPVRAALVCLHGIQSHAGWYEYSCSRFAQEGYDVYFLDRRGSGVNQQDRGDAPSFRRLLADLAEFLEIRRKTSNSTRALLLLAISWGGKLATALQRWRPNCHDGLILVTPGFFPQVQPPLGQRLRILGARIRCPQKLFPIPLNDPELFTDTPRWREFLRQDPLALHEATARLLIESVRLDGYLRFVPRFVTGPVLVLLAGKDRIIRNSPTIQFVARFATHDRQIIEYPAACHTLEFEPDPDVFIQDTLRWLERHVQ